MTVSAFCTNDLWKLMNVSAFCTNDLWNLMNVLALPISDLWKLVNVQAFGLRSYIASEHYCNGDTVTEGMAMQANHAQYS